MDTSVGAELKERRRCRRRRVRKRTYDTFTRHLTNQPWISIGDLTGDATLAVVYLDRNIQDYLYHATDEQGGHSVASATLLPKLLTGMIYYEPDTPLLPPRIRVQRTENVSERWDQPAHLLLQTGAYFEHPLWYPLDDDGYIQCTHTSNDGFNVEFVRHWTEFPQDTPIGYRGPAITRGSWRDTCETTPRIYNPYSE